LPRFIVVRGPGYEEVVRELERAGADYKLVSRGEVDEERVIEDIRGLPPQIRGRIRYGRGRPLPLTRRGRLNTENTCILLVYEGGKLVDVYPKMLGSRYVDPVEGARLSVGRLPQYHLYEEPALVLIAQHPELLGCARVRMVKDKVKLAEGYAEVDLVLEDARGGIVLVEVEEVATLNAVAQALSLAQAFQEAARTEVERVVVVALTAEEDAKRAAKKAGVEIRLLKLAPLR